MLAVARAAGVDVLPFTRLSTRMSLADRLLPPRLAGECGLPHSFVTGGRRGGDRRALVLEHGAGYVSDGDAEPILQGTRDSLTGVSVGGHGCEAFRGFMDLRRLPPVLEDPDREARALAEAFGAGRSSSAHAGLREWLVWCLRTPQPGLDWRDRFYLEQRMAGWMSSKEQLYDMARLERVPILNAARTYGLLLRLDEERRLGTRLHVAAISRLAPELLALPFNPPGRELGRLRGVLVRSRDDPLYVPRRAAQRLAKAVRRGMPGAA
jgi:hypothetical protein